MRLEKQTAANAASLLQERRKQNGAKKTLQQAEFLFLDSSVRLHFSDDRCLCVLVYIFLKMGK